MERYIDKSALVAEIEDWRDKIRKGIFDIPLTGSDRAYATFEYEILGKIKDFIDTLEVKEVDLKKEIREYLSTYWPEEKELHPFLGHIAQHFFELGLRVNNPITAADRGMADEIIINLKRVEQDYHIDLTRYMEWLRNLMKKGK